MQAGVGFHKPTTEAKLEKSKRFLTFRLFVQFFGLFESLGFEKSLCGLFSSLSKH